MEQMFRLLFLGQLAGFWLSLEEAQCLNLDNGISTASHCYNGSSGKICFTTFLANGGHPVRKSFKTASNWCNSTVPGSSLIVINSFESLRNVESFIGIQGLANETIITDAQRLPSSVSFQWSWVNGNATIPINVSAEELPGLDVACVESKHGQSLAYCTSTYRTQYSYICEYSDSRSAFSYQQSNKSYYVASEEVATWYDARNECLRSGGDLASITDLHTIRNWSQLNERHIQKYWIGLHRNQWIWNSTGAALTCTNWEGGYPDEPSDKQCICINPRCRRDNSGTICEYDRKWRNCNCNHNYVIVCQKHEKFGDEIVDTEAMMPSTSDEFLPVNPTSEMNTFTSSSSLATSKTGLFNSFNTAEIFFILFLFVTVIVIVFVVMLVIRKCKYSGRNEGSSLKKTDQNKAVLAEYETMVPDKIPQSDAVPIYSELELTQHPTPSNTTIYSNVQPTYEAVDMDINVVYVDPHEV